MKTLLVIVLAAHGAVHLMGFAKAFGLVDVPQLRVPIGPGLGVLWLIAALASLAAAALVVAQSRKWWIGAVPAAALSQFLIGTAWSDARYGTIPNAIVAAAALLSILDLRSSSLRSIWRAEAARGLAWPRSGAVVDDADLTPLPQPVQCYLRRVGVVGRPRVANFHAVFTGRIRGTPSARFFAGRFEQYNFHAGGETLRLFFVSATLWGVPVDVLHRFADGRATMKVRALGLFDIVDASGPDMTRSETVTLLNDMCVLAPATLVDAPIRWEDVDARRVRATLTHAGHSVSAELVFDECGDLRDFVSDDRRQIDGDAVRAATWSTPIARYGVYDGFQLFARGEGRWRDDRGEWTYLELTLDELDYNAPPPG